MIERFSPDKGVRLALMQLSVVAYLFLLQQAQSAESLPAQLPVCTFVNSVPVSPEKSQQNGFELFLVHVIAQGEDTD